MYVNKNVNLTSNCIIFIAFCTPTFLFVSRDNIVECFMFTINKFSCVTELKKIVALFMQNIYTYN